MVSTVPAERTSKKGVSICAGGRDVSPELRNLEQRAHCMLPRVVVNQHLQTAGMRDEELKWDAV